MLTINVAWLSKREVTIKGNGILDTSVEAAADPSL